jgi:predicted membrane protein
MSHTHRTRCGGGPHIVFGVLLVAWGVLALLDNLGLVELRNVLRTFWPLLIIAWGLSATFYGRRGRNWLGLFAVALGVILLGNQLTWWSVRFSMLWPVIVIVVGLRIMFRRRGWHRHRHLRGGPGDEPGAPDASPGVDDAREHGTSQSATLREVAVFGGIERRLASQAFRGGAATAVFGGVQLDLRDCRMAGGEAHIDVLAVLGGLSLAIPRDWAVDSQISAFLGGVDDRSTPPVDGSAKRLVLTGQTILGGVEIKN